MSGLLTPILDVVYPQHCRACGAWMHGAPRGTICGPCRERLAVVDGPACLRCGRPLAKYVEPEHGCAFCAREPYDFRRAVAGLVYDDASRPIIHKFKYSREHFLRVPLARYLLDAIRRTDLAEGVDAIGAVPLHWLRRVARGYNQSHLLASEVAAALKIPLRDRLLTRVRNTPSQTALSAAGRRRNMEGAFEAGRRAGRCRRVLLIDDVMTTGATASACARALRGAGVREVVVAVVAR